MDGATKRGTGGTALPVGHEAGPDRVRPAGLAPVLLTGLIALLSGCGGADLSSPDDAASVREPAPAGPFADASDQTPPDAVSGAAAPGPEASDVREGRDEGSGLDVRVGLSGASASLDQVDIAVDWSVSAPGAASLGSRSRLQAVLTATDGTRRILARVRVPDDAPAGRMDLVLEAPVTGTLVLELTGLQGAAAGTGEASVRVDLPAVVAPPPTPLDRLTSLSASRVPGSASSVREGGRRLHRFSVRVQGSVDGGDAMAVTGLESDVAAHFLMRENGARDVESPVRAAWYGEPIAVYLVLDVSSSIVLAGADGALIDAVSRTLATLAPVATFDYRTVASEVRRVPDLRSVEFDGVGSASGTAFHRGLDTALDDIEARGESHAVIIGFTDGRDFASRNFYPALRSDDEVLQHVASRLRRVRAARADAGEVLEAHFVSLGDDIDASALDALAAAGDGRHVPGGDAGALDGAFRQLSDELRGLYRLEYSSQRRAGDAALELEVLAGDRSSRVALP